MAFKDITKVLYDGKVKIDYKDKAHRYYARMRVDWTLPEDDKKAWGKIMYPKGTTTLIDQTLEKKGLMQWPKGLALRELFGFYDFVGEEGNRMVGFSKGVGTLWGDDDKLLALDQDTLQPLLVSAAAAWQRKQKKGADIGTVVHDAIEHFIKDLPFDIAEQYMWNIKESEYESEEMKDKALEEFPADVAQATQAFLQFQKWWLKTTPELYGAEDLLYSLEHNVCGTFDADIGVKREHHPRPEMFEGKDIIRCTSDWKTSNASKSKEACMPEGIHYQYFVQDAIYEMIRREMGLDPADDLLAVSARKDGGFSPIFASELGLTVDECLDWARATILCYRLAEKTKEGLVAHAEQAVVLEGEVFDV